MIKKNKMLGIRAVFLVLVLTLFSLFSSCLVFSQQLDLNLNAFLTKDIYVKGDIVSINVEVRNNMDNETDVVLAVEFETVEGKVENILSIEKQITIQAHGTYADVLKTSLAGVSAGEYFARVLSKNLQGGILQEKRLKFTVFAAPIFLDLKTCKDEECNKVSSSFLPEEKIILLVTTEDDVSIDGKCITPQGDSFNLNFVNNKAYIVSDRIGKHTVVITAKKGIEIDTKTISFTISSNNLRTVYLAGFIFVLLVLFALLMLLIKKRR